MLTKDQFIEYLNRIKNTNQKDDDLSQAVEKACNNNCRVIGLYSFECATMIELLSLVMGLEVGLRDGNILEYFIYDLDFGKEYSEGCYTEADGSPIDISTAERLYDYIVEEYNKRVK